MVPNVRGYACETKDGLIYIPLIYGGERSGAVGEFLDSLSPRCRIVNVISRRLAEMLARHGWTKTIEVTSDECVDVWQFAQLYCTVLTCSHFAIPSTGRCVAHPQHNPPNFFPLAGTK
jgi:hypothetical protein